MLKDILNELNESNSSNYKLDILKKELYKLANDKDITTDVIGAICAALEVEPNDIMEFIQE